MNRHRLRSGGGGLACQMRVYHTQNYPTLQVHHAHKKKMHSGPINTADYFTQ